MSLQSYRYYHLGGDGRLDLAEWFDADGDEDASAQVRAKHPDALCEIWQGTRLVASLRPNHFDPDDPAIQNAVGERLSTLANKRRQMQERRA